MIDDLRSRERVAHLPHRKAGRPVVAIVVVCSLLFIDVSLPVVGTSTRVLAVLVLALLLFGTDGVRAPFCEAMYFLLPLYVLLPIMFHPDVGTLDAMKVLILDYLIFLAGMVVLVRVMVVDKHRRILVDVLVLFAVVSAVVAALQRFGYLGKLGRDRWGDAATVEGVLRGAGFLPDPNFLAVLLAGVVPLIVSWRFTWLRAPSLAVVGFGLYATNSRAGLFLAVAALLLSIVARVSDANATGVLKGRKSVILVALCLVALFILNVGGQRDRVVQAFLIEAGVQNAVRTNDAVDSFVAHERVQLLQSWIDLGMKNLPTGVGVGTQTGVANAAHNTFVTLFGQGGFVGLAICLTLLLCFGYFVVRRSDPFAIMGMVVVLGGLTLSYSGVVFLVLPMGLADGILVGGLGKRTPYGLVGVPTSLGSSLMLATRHTQARVD